MEILNFILLAFCICFSLTLVAFFLFLITRKHAIIDIFWGPNIVATILLLSFKYGALDFKVFAILTILAIWATRLSLHFIIYKIFKPTPDRRYVNMVKNSDIKAMAKQYFIQIFFQVSISISGFYLVQPSPINISDSWFYFILTITSIAIFGEFLSDIQLQNFLKKTSGICTTGLWKFSRHPNYFFDLLFWFSISSFSFGSDYFFPSIVGPVIMFITFYFITGRITERCSVDKHGELYKDYQKRVSYIIPIPKLH